MLFYPFYFSISQFLHNLLITAAVRTFNSHEGLFRFCLEYASSVQSLSRVQLFATPWTAASQASLSITSSQSLLKLTSIESVMPSKHQLLCRLLLLPLQSFPASGSFQMSRLFASSGQSIGISALASVLSMNIQD